MYGVLNDGGAWYASEQSLEILLIIGKIQCCVILFYSVDFVVSFNLSDVFA